MFFSVLPFVMCYYDLSHRKLHTMEMKTVSPNSDRERVQIPLQVTLDDPG